MTTRLEALEAVAEAAEILAHSAGVIRGRTPEDADIYTHELEHIRHLMAMLSTLDALPASPPGEVVEVAAHVRLSRDGGAYIVSGMGCLNGGWKEPATGATIATITARVPISAIPTVSGTVRLALVKEAADVG